MGVTPTYGLPYPELDDPPNGPTLGKLLAEAVEARLAALDTRINNVLAVTEITSGVTLETGWVMQEMRLSKFLNRLVVGTLWIQRTGGDIAGGAGVTGDPQIGTLPAGWRPAINGTWSGDTGTIIAAGQVLTSGAFHIRAATGTAGNANYRIQMAYAVPS